MEKVTYLHLIIKGKLERELVLNGKFIVLKLSYMSSFLSNF